MMTEKTDSLSELYASGEESVLVVDEDKHVATSVCELLGKAEYIVDYRQSPEEAVELFHSKRFDIVLCDMKFIESPEQSFIRSTKEHNPACSFIVMSPYSSVESALGAIKAGADDYIGNPFNVEELLLTLKKVQERSRLRLENEMLRTQVAKRYSFSNIVAKNPAMSEIFETIKKIADYRTTVMLYGESGTGKELIAKAIHHNSTRKNKRFIAINCGAIPENLLESELFGHKKGSFTDATRDKKGLLEEANGGTILLDEIGEMPMHLQVKMLRVLQENEIRPVGEARTIPIDVRVIAATLRDLESDIIEGRFRDDLYYRLNVITLKIPPLRERKEDIPILVNHFIKKNQEKLGLAVYGIAKDAIARLIEHDWPGNIRELENCIERAMILTEGEELTLASLPKSVTGGTNGSNSVRVDLPNDQLSIKVHSRSLEENLIKRALEKTSGNRTHAAKLLEISHRTLLYKLKEYGLTDE